MYKKILVGFVLLALLTQSLVLPHVVSAQEPPSTWWTPTHSEFNEKVNAPPEGEIFGERYTHAQVWWIVYSVVNLVFGATTMRCAAVGSAAGEGEAAANAYGNCLLQSGVSLPSQQETFNNKPGDWGILALAALSDQMLSSKPASGVLYVSNVAQNILGVPEANAQEGGFGFNSLQPLQNIWAFSRNAAYALMTLAVVVLAFMIMFRMRISPQAAVTVQSAIPRIIIGLLLITFSFAIAGFIIDLAFVIQGVVSALVANSNLTSNNDVVFLFNRANDVVSGIVSYGILTIGVVLVIGGPTAVGLSGITGGLSIVAGIILFIIVIIIFAIALIKIFWLLLRSYVMIIFHLIALPFAALGYVASPSTNMFMSLLRSFIGQVSVFVTISLIVMFAHLVAWNMASTTWAFIGGEGSVLQPLTNPYLASIGGFSGTVNLPSFTGVDSGALAIFVGLVILLLSTGIASAVRDWITTGRFMMKENLGLYQAGATAGLAYGAYKVGKGEYPIPGMGIKSGPTLTIAGRTILGIPGMTSGTITGAKKLSEELVKRIR